MAQHTGQVKWFNNAKGYGFVGRDDGPDVFCHFTSIQADGYRGLKEGDDVDFDIIEGERAAPGRTRCESLQLKASYSYRLTGPEGHKQFVSL
jgi:CspA family cold shock protein